MKYKVKIEKLEDSRVKLHVSVAAKDFESLSQAAQNKVLGESKLNGFRDGKVPLEAFIKTYGEFPIRQEMGYMAVDKTFSEVVISEKVAAIGKPELSILKVNRDEDFEYEIIVDVLPEVEVGDYKLYAKKFIEEVVADPSEDEVNEAVEELRRMRATQTKDSEGKDIDTLPELTPEFLQGLGGFKTVEELKSRIKENILGEKKWRSEEKRKGQILESLVADTKTSVPKVLIENELYKIEQKIEADLAQMGVKFEDYLKHLKKSKDEWRAGETENAKKQVIIQLALNKISKLEKINVSEETLKAEVSHLLAQYSDLEEERARAYSEERMTNSLVAEFIYTGKVPNEKDLFGSHEGHNH